MAERSIGGVSPVTTPQAWPVIDRISSATASAWATPEQNMRTEFRSCTRVTVSATAAETFPVVLKVWIIDDATNSPPRIVIADVSVWLSAALLISEHR